VQKLFWLINAAMMLQSAPMMVAAMSVESLDGSAWILAELAGETLLDDVALTLAFDGGRVAGSDGCNRFQGAYDLEGDVLSFGEIASTMMACPEPVMRQARAFSDALERTHGVRLDEGALIFVDSDDVTVASFDPQPQDLAGSRWAVTGYNNGKQAVVSVSADATMTLEFDDAGNLGGSAGCNPYRGSYTADDGNIAVGTVATGMRACAEDVMAREDAFLKALGRSKTFRIEADRLEIRNEEGALQISAVRRDDDMP